MKKAFLTASALLCLIAPFALAAEADAPQPATNYAAMTGLQGKVKSVKETVYAAVQTPNGIQKASPETVLSQGEVHFNERGNMTAFTQEMAGQPPQSETFTEQDGGLRLVGMAHNADGSLQKTTVIDLSSRRPVIVTVLYGKGGKPVRQTRTQMTLDPEGRMQTSVTQDDLGHTLNTTQFDRRPDGMTLTSLQQGQTKTVQVQFLKRDAQGNPVEVCNPGPTPTYTVREIRYY